MLLRIIKETFLRRKKWIALVFVAVLLGALVISSLLTVYGDISSKMSHELRSFGANILVKSKSSVVDLEVGGISYTPPGTRTYLDERELTKIKTIFWRNNIVGFAPFLSVVVQAGNQPVVLTGTWFEKTVTIPKLAPEQFGEKLKSPNLEPTFTTGVKKIMPWWKLEGNWVSDNDEQGAIVGTEIASRMNIKIGERFILNYKGKPIELKAVGIVDTGSIEDNQVFVNLSVVQKLLGITYGVDKVLVSALVTPESKVASSIRGKKVEQMTPEEYEIWYCTPLVESIAYQIEEVVSDSDAGPIYQIAAAESNFLSKTDFLLLLITSMSLIASALGVMATMNAMVITRRQEIGLMKAIGAHDNQVATIFFLEAGLIGLIGGVFGYIGGLGLAQFIGLKVFGFPFAFSGIAFPITLLLAVAIALTGSLLPVMKAVKIEPIILLREV